MALEEMGGNDPEKDFIHMRGVDRAPKNPNAFINPFKAFIYFIMGNRGCLPLDEYIYTQNGIAQVKNVYDGMPILGGYVQKPHSFDDIVYEVTINKIKFRASGEHPLYVSKVWHTHPNHKKEYENWVTVKEIYDFYNSERKNKESVWHVQKYDSKNFKINEISVGKDLAKLLGYLMSDGSFSETQSIKFTNVNARILTEVAQLSMNLSEEFEIDTKYYAKGKGQDVLLTGKHGRNFSRLKNKLRELGVIDRSTFGKLQSLNEEELIEFIGGYFNGVGNLYPAKRPVITFYTGIHKALAYELQFMLWRLGINCLIDFRQRKKGYKGCWEVEISQSKSVRKLIDILDPIKYPEKFDKARQNLDKIKPTSDHFTDDIGEWIPITKIKKLGVKTVMGWETNPSQEIISYSGLRTHNSGKSSLDEVIAEENYKAGHTIVDLHSAGNYESLYWVICKECKKFWERWREINDKKPEKEQKKEPLHCECESRYKILLVVPEYVEIDERVIDEFNGKYYTKREWADLGHMEYGHYVTLENGDRMFKRPEKPNYVSWIKVRKIHVPNKGYKNRELFVSDLTSIMLQGKNERRIITTNPIFFKDMNHKLLILEKWLRELPEIIRSNFKTNTPKTVAQQRGVSEPVSFNKWTPQEINSHRVTLLIREFGSLVASQLTEERNQVIVKKAVFALVKVCRHFHVSLVGDMQRGGDVLKNVRDQRDFFLWKQSNIDIVPEDYEWMKKMIKEFRDKTAEKVGIGFAQKRYPNLEDLKPNEMYVLYPKKNERGNIFKKFTVKMPSFHHHSADDDFEEDSKEFSLGNGIGLIKQTSHNKDIATWRFVDKKKDGELTDTAQDQLAEDKKVKDTNMEKIFDLTIALMNPSDPSKKKMKAREVYEHVMTLGIAQEDWSFSAYSKWYQREKKKRGIK